MRIVKLNKDDIKDAIDLVWKVFQEFEGPYYSKEGVEEYKNFLYSNAIIDRFDKKEMLFWGYKDKDNLVGVIATRGTNHISMLFVNKEYHKQGIASDLIQVVKERCEGQCNITVNSSPYAIDFYHKLGFSDTGKELTMDGIRFTPMSCLLK